MWITNGGFADLFTIFAKVDGEKFTAFLVERGMGVVSGPDEKKLGPRRIVDDRADAGQRAVPVENVLGTIGEGHKVAFNILNLGRVKLGTRNIAGVRQALTNATQYAKQRRQFGQAIAEFGLIKQKLAEMVDSLLRRRRDGLSRARRRRPRAATASIRPTASRCSRPSRASRSSAR